MSTLLWLILLWLAASRLVTPMILHQLSWGYLWPSGPTPRQWAIKALLCPEWAWVKYHRASASARRVPVGWYCKGLTPSPRDDRAYCQEHNLDV